MANVKLKNIHKSFNGKKKVLDNVNLCIEDKSFVVIIGSSGCGKTTLLNIIAGLELPSIGEVFINDNCMNHVEPKDRDIAMVFQNYALYPHLSVYDNLAFALELKHVHKDQIYKKVNDVATLLGISDLLKRKPQQLSGGQMQRVAIGKAIVREPLVFLMDEPLSNLDINLKNSMRDELRKLHKDLEATFVYVTHDQTEAMTLATTLVVMNEGKIQQVGTPYEVFMTPQNLFVGQFIGTPAMNLFSCSVTTHDEYSYVNLLGLNLKLNVLETSEGKNSLPNQIVVGIRPEDFVLCKNDIGICANIVYYEFTGSEINLHCKTEIAESSSLVIKAAMDESLMNLTQVKIFPKNERLHFFHPVTSERLLLQCKVQGLTLN